MASLTRKSQSYAVAPDWLDNRAQAAPFRVKVFRRSNADVDAFGARCDEAIRAWSSQTEESLFAIFDGYLDGPFGNLEVDGEKIVEGDLRALLRLALYEPPALGGSLFLTLANTVIEVNGVSEIAAKNCERRRGGTGTSTTAASSLPPAADAAAAPSSAETTS